MCAVITLWESVTKWQTILEQNVHKRGQTQCETPRCIQNNRLHHRQSIQQINFSLSTTLTQVHHHTLPPNDKVLKLEISWLPFLQKTVQRSIGKNNTWPSSICSNSSHHLTEICGNRLRRQTHGQTCSADLIWIRKYANS